MANDKPESRPDQPGESESLSATGMFLRAFGEGGKAEPAAADPLFGTPAPSPAQPQAEQQRAEQPAAAKPPGEFTQLFQSLDRKPTAAPQTPAAAETQYRPETSPVKAPPQVPAEQGGDRSPGEFTKIFVGGVNPPPAAPPRVSEELPRPAPAATPGPPRAKGFSAPGVSGSASGEGSFTQLFNTPSTSPNRPQAPAPPPSASRNTSWDNDPLFRSPENPPPAESGSPSVTSLLSSLGTPAAPAGGRQPEPVPYRPEPSSRPTPLISPEPPEVTPGGVTRLIQRLAQTPAEPTPAPPAVPAAPPVSSGPGEFTRLISRLEHPVAEPPPAAAAPAPAPFAFPPAPPMPTVAPPAAPPAPRFAPPPMPAAPLPAAPKPPALAAPALAPPKSKLEAMVPILLVINTFLLLILLIVVIFLIKSK